VARTAEKLASEFDLPAVELFQLLEEGLEAEDEEERVPGRPFAYNTLNVYLAGVAEIQKVQAYSRTARAHAASVRASSSRTRESAASMTATTLSRLRRCSSCY
jgi:hypothetical protein